MDTTSGAQGGGPAGGAAVRIARQALDAYPGGMILLDGLDRPLDCGPRSDALLAALDRESRGGPREAGAP
ncbi:MAG: hypothetical protein LDL44_13120, partial [Caenispirillum sp.]|nr:hypothetical protein [Caenispirillum sp.]